jgi:uncharacterized protein YecT (DUF1311 family)
MNSRFLFPLAAISASFGASSPLRAQHMNAIDAPCKAAGTGVDQANCLNFAAKKADADLNNAYRRIIGMLATGDRQKLQSAERTWLTYRNQTCAAERNFYKGGTGAFAAYRACLEALIPRFDDRDSVGVAKIVSE